MSRRYGSATPCVRAFWDNLLRRREASRSPTRSPQLRPSRDGIAGASRVGPVSGQEGGHGVDDRSGDLVAGVGHDPELAGWQGPVDDARGFDGTEHVAVPGEDQGRGGDGCEVVDGVANWCDGA